MKMTPKLIFDPLVFRLAKFRSERGLHRKDKSQ